MLARSCTLTVVKQLRAFIFGSSVDTGQFIAGSRIIRSSKIEALMMPNDEVILDHYGSFLIIFGRKSEGSLIEPTEKIILPERGEPDGEIVKAIELIKLGFLTIKASN